MQSDDIVNSDVTTPETIDGKIRISTSSEKENSRPIHKEHFGVRYMSRKLIPEDNFVIKK